MVTSLFLVYNRLIIHIGKRLVKQEKCRYFSSFFVIIVIFNEEDENWVYAINTNYKETLNIEMSDAIKQKSQLCICTMIDMSEVGCFNRKLLEPILKYIEEHQMTIVDKIRGIIICRGYQNNKYQRIMEIQIPIKP